MLKINSTAPYNDHHLTFDIQSAMWISTLWNKQLIRDVNTENHWEIFLVIPERNIRPVTFRLIQLIEQIDAHWFFCNINTSIRFFLRLIIVRRVNDDARVKQPAFLIRIQWSIFSLSRFVSTSSLVIIIFLAIHVPSAFHQKMNKQKTQKLLSAMRKINRTLEPIIHSHAFLIIFGFIRVWWYFDFGQWYRAVYVYAHKRSLHSPFYRQCFQFINCWPCPRTFFSNVAYIDFLISFYSYQLPITLWIFPLHQFNQLNNNLMQKQTETPLKQ